MSLTTIIAADVGFATMIIIAVVGYYLLAKDLIRFLKKKKDFNVVA